MNQQEEMDIRLWAFIEGRCSAEEQHSVRELIDTFPLWKTAYNETLVMHKILTRLQPAQPSIRFTQNVMDAVDKANPAPKINHYTDIRIVRGIAATLVLLIIVMLAIGLSSVSRSDSGALSHDALSKAADYFRNMAGTFWPYFIMANIIGALALIDAVYHGKQRIASAE